MICYHIMCFIFILLTAVITGSLSFELYTENFITAVRGRNISLPCTFSVPAYVVYWYKHASTGASDENSTVVASEYLGSVNPVPGFERFDLSDDYRLVIRDVSVLDETTYSCLVFPPLELGESEERGYTDLRVIALGELVIESCEITSSRSCNFAIGEDPPVEVTLVCKLHDIRPPTNLTWMTRDGKLLETSYHQTKEKDGLYHISSHLQVSESDFDYQYVCQAKGEAVNGTSSMTVTFDRKTGPHIWGIHGGYIFLIVVILAVVLTIFAAIYYKLSGFPFLSRVAKSARPAQLDNVQSQPLNEEQENHELQMATLKRQNDALMKARDEDRARFEEEKLFMESSWKKELEAKTQSVEDAERQIQNLQTQIKEQENHELQMATLKRQYDALMKARDEDRARFIGKKFSMEPSWKKEPDAEIVEELRLWIVVKKFEEKIQGLQVERTERLINAVTKERDELRATIKKGELSMENAKGLNDKTRQVEDLKIKLMQQEQQLARIKQQKETLMRERDKIIAILKDNKLPVESSWKKGFNATTQEMEGLRNRIEDFKTHLKLQDHRFCKVECRGRLQTI